MAEENRFEQDEGVEIPVETAADEASEKTDGNASDSRASGETEDGAKGAEPLESGAEAERSDSPHQEDAKEDGPEENPEEDPENDSGTDAEKDPEDDEKDDGKEEKAGFFGRRKDKEKEKLKTQVEELNDRLLRSLAEFDNYRKRTEKEKTANYAIGARDVVEKILPVADSFERGLSSAPEEDPFAEGMRMIYKQLMTALEDLGVRPIEAVGQPFDPNLHNAVMHVDDEEAGENVVVEEFQKGYTYKDSVVRHSMVKVAN